MKDLTMSVENTLKEFLTKISKASKPNNSGYIPYHTFNADEVIKEFLESDISDKTTFYFRKFLMRKYERFNNETLKNNLEKSNT